MFRYIVDSLCYCVLYVVSLLCAVVEVVGIVGCCWDGGGEEKREQHSQEHVGTKTQNYNCIVEGEAIDRHCTRELSLLCVVLLYPSAISSKWMYPPLCGYTQKSVWWVVKSEKGEMEIVGEHSAKKRRALGCSYCWCGGGEFKSRPLWEKG